MATKKKAKKKVPKLTLYREIANEYVITGEGLSELLGWPEGFSIEGVHANCKKKFVDIKGMRISTIKEKNKITVITENLNRRVTDKEARKILGLAKSEAVDYVGYDSDSLTVSTIDSYNGPYKA